MHFVASKVVLNYIFMEKILIRTKNTLKVNKSEPNIRCSHETLNLNNSSKKKGNSKKSFNISNSTLDELFNDTTHISLR